jgi:hypothetical protein
MIKYDVNPKNPRWRGALKGALDRCFIFDHLNNRESPYPPVFSIVFIKRFVSLN